MAATDDTIAELRRVPYFAPLRDRELRAIARLTGEVEHPAGGDIVSEGGGAAAFHLVVEGEAVVLRGDREIRRLGPGDFFGEISLIDGLPRTATVRAITPLRTLSVASWEFATLLEDHFAITRQVLLTLCGRLREAEAAIGG